MSTNEITAKIEALKAIEDLIEEAKAEAETLRDDLKQEMLMRDTEELTAGQYIVRWTSVLSQRFDTTAFKKVMLKDFSVLQDTPFTDKGSIVEIFTDLSLWMGIKGVIDRINANAAC